MPDGALTAKRQEIALLRRLEERILWLAAWTIHNANHLRESRDGLKVGGHQASSASLTTIMTALYMKALRPQDRVAVKPHASPVFHAIQHLFGRQSLDNLKRFRALGGAQSYPSRTKDVDDVDFSTGSVGLGVAMTAFASLTQDYLAARGAVKPEKMGRMISLLGDAELDEGNIYEALIEACKHDIRNTWWIVDYNRQSLDATTQDRMFTRYGEIDLGAEQVGLGHAVDRRHPLDQIAVGVVGQLQRVQRRRGQVQDDDRRSVGVGLGDLRRVGLIGQVAGYTADGVAHVIGRRVQIAVQVERDADVRAAVARRAVDPVDALDAGDLALDHLGDALFDDFSRGAAIAGRDRDHRRIDARQLTDRQRGVGRQTNDTEDDRRDGGEYRATDGKVGQHQPALRSAPPLPSGFGPPGLPPLIAAPSWMRLRPSATILSPFFRPERISTKLS